MANRTFTLSEAQNLLPVLESLLRNAIDSKSAAQNIDHEFEQLKLRIHVAGGLLVDVRQVATQKLQREKAVQRLKDTLAEIASIGVQVKDVDIGLLDFPCIVEGRPILLCWKLGEKTISHWHGIDEGFQGRKPIDESIINPKKPREQD